MLGRSDDVSIRIIIGDCRDALRTLPDCSVHCVVTSPPYFGLRDYGVNGQIGLEPTPEAFVAEMVAVFREVRRVLRDDGTLWLNLGDSYALRQDIIWHKPNPMPESVSDRCSKAHEYIFLLSKSDRYYFDQDSILEEASANTHARLSQDVANQIGSDRAHGGAKTNGAMKAVMRGKGKYADADKNDRAGSSLKDAACLVVPYRNKRSVWTVGTQPFSEAHFATFPPALIEPCILAGCPEGGAVLDPFGGAGTTGLVADRLRRNAILIELNPEYAAIAQRRIDGEAGMLSDVRVETLGAPEVASA
jgi:DNA modification methylase